MFTVARMLSVEDEINDNLPLVWNHTLAAVLDIISWAQPNRL